VGGVAPVVVAVVLWLLLPESVRFLALRQPDSSPMREIIARMRPDLADAEVRLVPDPQQEETGGNRLRELLAGTRLMMAPLLWCVYVANTMATYALVSWTPTLMEAKGLPATSSALVGSLLAVGGTVGGLVAARGVDRFGLLAFCLLPGFATF